MTTKQTPDPEPNKNPNDKATAMENTTNVVMDGQMYNVLGQRVGEGYRGIVIKNGEKFLY